MTDTIKEYEGNASTVRFAAPTPYLLASHIRVYVGEPLVETTDFTVDTVTSEVVLTTPPPAPSAPGIKNVRVQRDTPSQPLVDFQSPGAILKADLNTATKQFLYQIEEWEDQFEQDAILDESITQAKLAKPSVDTPELVDLGVTTAKLDDDAVTVGKLAEQAAYTVLANDTAGVANPAHRSIDDLTVLADGSTTRRDLSARAADMVNVKDFGAVGDGVADDTAAIQAAMNTSKNVFIPKGVYYVTKASLEALPDFGIKPPTGIKVFGEGFGSRILLEPGVDVRHILVGFNEDSVTLESLCIDGNGSNANGLGCSNVTGWMVSNCHFVNIDGGNWSEDPTTPPLGGGRGITFQNVCNSCLITGCRFDTCFAGIDLMGASADKSTALTAFNNAFENCDMVFEIFGVDYQIQKLGADRQLLSYTNCIVDGITFKNCGKSRPKQFRSTWQRRNSTGNSLPWASPARAGTSYASMDWENLAYEGSGANPAWSPAGSYTVGQKVNVETGDNYSAIIAIQGGHGVSISNVQGFNDTAYGTVGALYRGTSQHVQLTNVNVNIDVETLIRFGPTPVLNNLHREEATAECVFMDNITNIGPTETVVEADNPLNTANDYVVFGLNLTNIRIFEPTNTQIVGPRIAANSRDHAMFMQVHNLYSGGFIQGTMKAILDGGNVLTSVGSSSTYGNKQMFHHPLTSSVDSWGNSIKCVRTGSSPGSFLLGISGSTTLITGAQKLQLDEPSSSYALKDSSGTVYTLSVDTSGRLLINGAVVGLQT